MQAIIKSHNITSDISNILSDIKYDKLFILTDEHTIKLCLPLLKDVEIIEIGRASCRERV